ncbi:MAG: hypothetical protein HQ556_03410 [Candidatus Marinimicrobia bacterium]|nr:hypothetical protein [Candidatus Neomarinimicrobiota bacterium]
MQSEYNKATHPSTKGLALSLIFMLGLTLSNCTSDQVAFVKVVSDSSGHKLTVDDADFFVHGMNWDYYPIGTNYKYILWDQPDDFIKSVLKEEMIALQAMRVNTIRQYVGVPPRWVEYIYETYGIFTILNHTFSRYGMEINGNWVANVDYGDSLTRELILTEVISMVEQFRYVPGVLMWLLGNENNYGLIWESANTQDMPEAQENDHQKARDLYSLFNEAIRILHIRDNHHPVAIANGDVQFIDLIAQEIENLDIFGTNSYRGASFENLFQVVNDKLDIPVLLTEFGADAFSAIEMREDQESQALVLLENWREIYEQAHGNGGYGNTLGGLTFQFSDGWWKSGPDDKLDYHDSTASWSNGGYSSDFIHGLNNMNEEWFGICGREVSATQDRDILRPRLAYHVLRKIHALDPLAPTLDSSDIQKYFSSLAQSNLDSLKSIYEFYNN